MKVGTYTGQTNYTVNDNVCPQLLLIRKTAGNFPSKLRVTVSGRGTIKDIDLQQMKRESEWINKYQSPVSFDFLAIPIADGYFGDTRTTIEVTTGAAGDAFDLFYWNQNKGAMFLVTEQVKAFASQPFRQEKFCFMTVEGSADTDVFNLTFSNDVTHTSTKSELQVEYMEFSAAFASGTDTCIDNFDQVYRLVEVVPAADRQVFVTRFVEG